MDNTAIHHTLPTNGEVYYRAMYAVSMEYFPSMHCPIIPTNYATQVEFMYADFASLKSIILLCLGNKIATSIRTLVEWDWRRVSEHEHTLEQS